MDLKTSIHNNYGIWVGENATIAITEKMEIAFLRIKKDRILAILKRIDNGNKCTTYVVEGVGDRKNATVNTCCKAANGKLCSTNKAVKEYIALHDKDTIELKNDTDIPSIIYTLHDGTKFYCNLAEKVEMTEIDNVPEPLSKLSAKECLEKWRLGTAYSAKGKSIVASIDTHRYSINFEVYDGGKGSIYCRTGKNGYTKKGFAMLPTTVIRNNEVRIIENNLNAINPYIPDLDYFVENACAFPSDGGWYWSFKELTDDIIVVQGCNEKPYCFYRMKQFEERIK